MSKTVTLKLLSAVAIAGQVIDAGETVEVDAVLGQNLIYRGKAEDPNAIAVERDPADSEGGGVTTDQDARARALADNNLTVAEFEALSKAKREALLKAARAAVAAEDRANS